LLDVNLVWVGQDESRRRMATLPPARVTRRPGTQGDTNSTAAERNARTEDDALWPGQREGPIAIPFDRVRGCRKKSPHRRGGIKRRQGRTSKNLLTKYVEFGGDQRKVVRRALSQIGRLTYREKFIG